MRNRGMPGRSPGIRLCRDRPDAEPVEASGLIPAVRGEASHLAGARRWAEHNQAASAPGLTAAVQAQAIARSPSQAPIPRLTCADGASSRDGTAGGPAVWRQNARQVARRPGGAGPRRLASAALAAGAVLWHGRADLAEQRERSAPPGLGGGRPAGEGFGEQQLRARLAEAVAGLAMDGERLLRGADGLVAGHSAAELDGGQDGQRLTLQEAVSRLAGVRERGLCLGDRLVDLPEAVQGGGEGDLRVDPGVAKAAVARD